MINNVSIEEISLLSAVQQDLLYTEVASQSQGRSLLQKLYSLRGPLNIPALQKAYDLVVAKNPLLRTSIHWERLEKPVMVIHNQIVLPMIRQDWKEVAALEMPAKLKQECRIELERAFELEKPPLFRVVLMETAADRWFFLWTAEKLVLDECSVELLVRELWHVYSELSSGNQPDLAVEDLFNDYSKWLAIDDPAAAELFWRTNLQGVGEDHSSEIIRMPLDANVQGEAGSVTLKMAGVSAEQIISEHGEARLHALVYGSWALLLHCHFGTTNTIFGVTISGRRDSYGRAEQVCGPLASVVPFRVTVPANQPVDAWLTELELQWQYVNRHGNWGLGTIMEWGGIPRQKRTFETAVSVRVSVPLSLAGKAPGLEEVEAASSLHSGLELRVTTAGGISLELAHNASFGKQLMQPLLTRFSRIMEALNRGQTPTRIQVLTDDERRQLERWSDGGTRPVEQPSIQQAIEEHARRAPEAIAAVFETERITYGQLNSKTNQLAAHLKNLGVKPEAIVGVFMGRCLETLIAIVGILKSGGCYLPLETELPQDRLTYMLQDANPSILLTKQDHLFDLPLAAAGCEVICLDSDWEQISSRSNEEHPPQHPDALAYIIYTSGSTGQPKGVAVSQGAAIDHLLSIGKAFGYLQEDRILQFASLSFDVSIEQLLAPLVAGASVILKDNAPWDRTEFLKAVTRFGITVANVPPAFWSRLVPEEKADFTASSLRLMIVGGDAMSPETLRHWNRNIQGRMELLNAYGPTEAVITATLFRVPAEFSHVEVNRVPIGCPLPNRKAYIVNHLELAPAGFRGELLLGGDCLARGYVNRPDLTAAKFVPDPFSGKPGARLYRTGDIARYGTDGQIEFLGRSDNQVKIRGYRIELEEIELAIMEHPEVRQAAVSTRSSEHGEKRLIGYVVAAEASQLSAAELRDFIKQKLPEYMAPSQLIFVDALPLTISGKIDRNLLYTLEEKQEVAAESTAVPIKPTEKALMKIWTDVLGNSQIGIHDDFFDSGGDSLLATQIMTRVQKAFGVEVPLRIMFEFPTIAGFAGAIEEYGASSEQQLDLVQIERVPYYPLSPAQERLWFLCQMGGQSEIYNMTGMIRLEGELDVEVMEKVLTEVVRRHEALRTVFPTREDNPVQVIQPPYTVHPVLTDLSASTVGDQDEELLRISREEAELPFDLVHGPVFRARLVRFSPTDHVLLSTIHHIACDGWSVAVLVKEIGILYCAFLRNEESPLADLRFQYVDFAEWQRRNLERTFEKHMEYWRRRLGGAPSPVSLPRERHNIQKVSFRGDSYSFRVSTEILNSLKVISQETKASLFMTLLAGLKILIHSYTDCEDIVVGTDIANRTHLQTEEIIGLFVNVLALRSNMGDNPTLLEAISRVREITLEAYEHQDVPFDRVVQELNPNRTSNLTPLFKVFFDMRRPALELLELPGLKISQLELKATTAQFDLVLFASETTEELACEFNYRIDLFDAESIQRIADDYIMVLEHMGARPDMRIGALQSLLERKLLKKSKVTAI
jgi:amino acid adenylation domain-containing protein